MEDDPDDLAAAFFAQQAAKEKAKTTLPTDDWIRVIEATTKQSASAAPDDGNATRKSGDDTLVDPSSWLVTTMSPAPKCHADGNEDGIVGILLDSSDITCCSLGKTNAGEDTNAGGMK